jgi:hypothetical protein
MRTWVYVDGFNLYYGALKGTPYKWLNLAALAKEFLPPSHTIEKIKYFTARVSGAADPDAPRRQQLYLNALSTLPEVEVYYGRFLSKSIWRPIINFPVSGADSLAGDDYITDGYSRCDRRVIDREVSPCREHLSPERG